MPSVLRADVLVIGGGPAGATAAFQLATAGFDVLLIDRARFPRDKTCGESLSPGALARLRAIGMWEPAAGGGAVAREASPWTIRGMRIRSPRGTTFRGHYKTTESGSGLAIRRSVLDSELLAQARSRGVRTIEGLEAIGVEHMAPDEAVVVARTVGETGRTHLAARRVVVADGRQSFLARSLGFIEADAGSRRPRRYAVRAHCDVVSELSELAEMHVGEGGYCGIAPLSKTSANVCYVHFANRLDLTPRTAEADFRRHLRAYPDAARRLESCQLHGPIRVAGPLRLISNRQHHGAFIACGDTTGFLDPFTGEGIAHAIASGVLGAQAVCSSLSGSTDAFPRYQREIRELRRIKGIAALTLYGLVSRRSLANAAASVFSCLPRLGDAAVRLFGDQV